MQIFRAVPRMISIAWRAFNIHTPIGPKRIECKNWSLWWAWIQDPEHSNHHSVCPVLYVNDGIGYVPGQADCEEMLSMPDETIPPAVKELLREHIRFHVNLEGEFQVTVWLYERPEWI